MPFSELPYCDGKFTSDQELTEFIKSVEEVKTDEEIKEDVHRMMDEYLEDYLGI